MKNTKFLAVLLCLLLACTVALCACEVPDDDNGEYDDNAFYQASNKKDWKRVLSKTVDATEPRNANYTLQITLSAGDDLDGYQEQIIVLKVDEDVYFQSATLKKDRRVQEQYEHFWSEEDGACDRRYDSTIGRMGDWQWTYAESSMLSSMWEEISSVVDVLSDSYDEFVFSDGVYTAHDLDWSPANGDDWQDYFITECNVVLTGAGIRKLYGVVTVGEGRYREELNYSIELTAVGTTQLTFPEF